MSNVGQVALIAVGTVVGFYVGYPALGFALGSLAGSVLFPTQGPAGPKIGDNRTTTSSIGDPVAWVFGTADVAGTIMWLAPYVQTTHGSKGGASQTTYSYTQSVAIGLCRGPILGLSRIWENGAIVYDSRPQQPARVDLNLLAETNDEYSARMQASATYAETFVLYLGDEAQLADPTIESIQGMGNVPAFRGLAYIVYPNRALQTAQAWRHPNFKFEVACAALSVGAWVPAAPPPIAGIIQPGFARPPMISPTVSCLGYSAIPGSLGGSIVSGSLGPMLFLGYLRGSEEYVLMVLPFGFDVSTIASLQCSVFAVSGAGVRQDTPVSTYHAARMTSYCANINGESSNVGDATNYKYIVCSWGLDLSVVVAGWDAAGQPKNGTPGNPFEPGAQVAFSLTMAASASTGSATGAGTSGVSVASIIATICNRSGLPPVDVRDMTSVYVDGYSISTICTGTDMLTPLRSVAFFDAVESNAVLKFQARGAPSVATFTTDDFGAYDAAGSGAKSVPPSISSTRAQDEDLPRSIRLRYKATALDYQDSEQLSPYRLQTLSTNDIDVSLAICMSDTLALQCAEVLWADTWAARVAYTLSVDQAWLALDCGDCIDVPVDGVLERMRIVSDSNASGVLRKLSCVRDDGDAFMSTAVAQPIQQTPQKLTIISPSSYELLDLPALQDADDDPGFYVAAQRTAGAGNVFQGCVLYESSDSGATFTPLFSIVAESTCGTIAAAVPASQAFTWDMATTVTVNVPAKYSFESLTDAAVIAGGNAAAMGADGRWEVIQFATAIQVSVTQWTLSRLLRGRRGTEHILGTSVSGDAFVMLAAGALGRVPLQTATIGASRMYKAVSIGATYASGINATFAGHAGSLVPFSPVAIQGAYNSGGDIVLRWIRRSRLGRTLMSGADIALNEATEAYQVDIYSGASAPTVVRTLSVSAQTATYTAADQLADFGADRISAIGVAVYQMSAIVGRGTPALATILLSSTEISMTSVSVPMGAAGLTELFSEQPRLADVAFSDDVASKLYQGMFYGPYAAPPDQISDNGWLVLGCGPQGGVAVATQNHKSQAGLLPYLDPTKPFYVEFMTSSSRSTNLHPAVWIEPQKHNLHHADVEVGGPAGAEEWIEIDIDECYGSQTLCTIIHWKGTSPNYVAEAHNNYGTGPTLDRTQPHRFGFGYDPATKMGRFYLDDVNHFSLSTVPFDAVLQASPFYLIMDTAPGTPNVPFNMTVYSFSAWGSAAP